MKFTYYKEASTIDEQVKRYYLLIKNYKPEIAEIMSNEISPILKKGVNSDREARTLCEILYRYTTPVIYYGGSSYTMYNNAMTRRSLKDT